MQKPKQNKAQDNLCHSCPKLGKCPLQNLPDDQKASKCMHARAAYLEGVNRRTMEYMKSAAEKMRQAAEIDKQTAKINEENMRRLHRLALEMAKREKERIEVHYGQKGLTQIADGIYYKDPRPNYRRWTSGRVVALIERKAVNEGVCKRKDLPRLALVPLKGKIRLCAPRPEDRALLGYVFLN